MSILAGAANVAEKGCSDGFTSLQPIRFEEAEGGDIGGSQLQLWEAPLVADIEQDLEEQRQAEEHECEAMADELLAELA